MEKEIYLDCVKSELDKFLKIKHVQHLQIKKNEYSSEELKFNGKEFLYKDKVILSEKQVSKLVKKNEKATKIKFGSYLNK